MPKATYEEGRKLARLSSDCSFLLTHLVRQNDGKTDDQALEIMKLILDLNSSPPKPILKKGATGWYSSNNSKTFDPNTNNFIGMTNTESVCFTESTLFGLKAHAEVFKAKFGIAFSRNRLMSAGANPCIQINDTLLKSKSHASAIYYNKLFNYIPAGLIPFVNIISDTFDATHEREWRIADNFKFVYSDIVFIFCPTFRFKEFSRIQKDGRPVLFDLGWLELL